MTKPTGISFLLGAGFSRPAGYPLANELNARFACLQEHQFTIHTDGGAWFHGGNPNPNDWFVHKEDRIFAERLIAHYCEAHGGESSFHYEVFYDWYKAVRHQRTHDPEVNPIANGLGMDPANALLGFDLTFNQLLADPLLKWYPEIHYSRGLPVSHSKFLELIERMAIRATTLHFHTLDHDLFFESLSSTDAIQGKLADGFLESGSPFYGRLTVSLEPKGSYSYMVRLSRFVDLYDSEFNLYKLHGSVDFYSSQLGTFKTRKGIGPTNFFRETRQGSEVTYEPLHGLYHPDFLSGTTYKTLQYDSTPYYDTVFRHFRENLQASQALVVIGYRWGDDAINRIVDTCFCPGEGRLILNIDVVPPRIPRAWSGFFRYFPGGVSDFDANAVLGELDDVS